MGTSVPTAAADLLRLATGPDRHSDAQLLDDYLRGSNSTAVAAIIRRHGPMVWGVCRRVLGHHDAEDAFQATFLVLARRAGAIRPGGLLGNWLYGVARRTSLKARALAARRRAREVTVDELPEPAAPEPAAWADVRPVLDHELERLPAKYRAPLILCDLEGMTRPEAARRLGWPEGTVNSRLSIGRKKLAVRLARRGLALSGGLLTVTLVEQATGRVPAEVFDRTVRLLNDPAVAPATAALLAQKVTQAMTLDRLKLPALVLAVAGLAGGGLFLRPAAEDPPPAKPVVPVTTDERPLVLRGHADSVFAVAFSPDGKTIASGSFDKTIKLWDVATGKEIRTLSGHTKEVVSISFSPDGKRLASAASQYFGNPEPTPGEVKTWDTATGLELRDFEGHGWPAYAVAFSPDGSRILAAGGGASVSIWDSQTGKKMPSFSTGNAPFYALAVSPDGRWFAIGGMDKRVRVRSVLMNPDEGFSTSEHPDPVFAVAYSPDGKVIASAGAGKPTGIHLWDAETGERRPMIESPQRTIRSLAFSKDGKLIAAGAFDGTARLFDVASGKEVLALKGFGSNVNAVALSPDGTKLAVATEDKLVRIYTLTTAGAPAPKEPTKPETPDARQTAASFLELAIAGKLKEAREHADPAHISENKVREIQKLGLKRVDVSIAQAGSTDALVITEPVDLPKEGKGHVLVYLRQKDGAWRVRDIDFEPSERALQKQRDFLERYADARPVHEKK
jgi:RNA polymerase sigma factor (sigma-70 family)